MLDAHKLQSAIEARLTPEALAWWVGCNQEVIDELVIHAQDTGVDAAVAEIEALATVDSDDDA